jgi:hypothetical protein
MAQPEGKCPHCGGPVTDVKMAVEYAAVHEHSREVRGASRNFWGHCAEHGKVMAVTIMGNHATLGEAELKRRYSKQARKLILQQIDAPEAKAFRLALVGKRRPSAEQIRLWDRLSIGARASLFDRWTAFLRGGKD